LTDILRTIVLLAEAFLLRLGYLPKNGGGIMSLSNIGQARNANNLAKALNIPRSTVYNNPRSFRGVTRGERWWFFDNLVEEALRSQVKGGINVSMEKGQERETSALWPNQIRGRKTESKEMRNMGTGSEVGTRGKGQSQAASEVDPHGLLDYP
jgi:hypothetical protein